MVDRRKGGQEKMGEEKGRGVKEREYLVFDQQGRRDACCRSQAR